MWQVKRLNHFKLRRVIQFGSFFAINNHFHKHIYQGPLKGICAPALNCYACPLARFSCPLGSLQHGLVIRQFPFYVLGFIGLVGVIAGRLACSFLCPFGFLQDLLYKIKTIKIKIPKYFSYFKFVMLAGVVFILVWITKETWFCKLCPAGTIGGGIPTLGFDKALRPLVSSLFYMKYTILIIILGSAILIKRVFCRVLCPLGAIWGLLNYVSLLKLKVDKNKCNECSICYKVCPMDVKVYEQNEHFDCIRCFNCSAACPQNAIKINIVK